jgi:hypothetical protein
MTTKIEVYYRKLEFSSVNASAGQQIEAPEGNDP